MSDLQDKLDRGEIILDQYRGPGVEAGHFLWFRGIGRRLRQ
jgi:hypothetical protein